MLPHKNSIKLLIGILILLTISLASETKDRYLKNIRQLTFGGENAEAYFSKDGKNLIFQSTRDGYDCDQIYTMTSKGRQLKKVSTGKRALGALK